jgi:tetratricopeptide (TPR) repeat protein
VLAFFFPLISQAAQAEGTAEYSLPFGRYIPETAARRIARTTAWLNALEKTTEALSTASLVQWGSGEESGRQALVSAVFTPAVSSASVAHQVSVQVRLVTPQRTVEDRLRKMLPEREMLNMRVEMLKLARKKAEEARRLIELPAALRRNAVGGRAAYRTRIDQLADQLEALWLLGNILPQREGGRWSEPREALPVLQQATALDPGYAPLLYLQGEIFLQLDRPQDALEKLDKALTLNPELAGALFTRGVAYLRLQLPTLAERDLNAALERDDSHAAWWRARGALRMIRNESGPMCEDFTQACARGDCEGLAVARERGLCMAKE